MTRTTKFTSATESEPAWPDAQEALAQYRKTRLPADWQKAVQVLQPLCFRIALHLTGFNHMDQKLFGPMRRTKEDRKEMAWDASNSVLVTRRKGSGASGVSTITNNFHPEKGTLENYVYEMVANKLLGYLRKEPIKGLIGPKVAPKDAPNLSSLYDRIGSMSRRDENAQALDWDTGASIDSCESDSYVPTVLSEVLEILTEEEREVVCCEMLGLTQEEACAKLCSKHGPQSNGEPYIKRGAYRYRFEAARRKLLEAWPELNS